MTSVPLTVLAAIALVFFLDYAQPILVPLLVAGVLHFLLRPVVRRLARLGLSGPFAAAVVVGGLVAGVGALSWALAPAAQRWVAELPQALDDAAHRLEELREPVEAVGETAKRVQDMALLEGESNGDEVVVKDSDSTGSTLVANAGAALGTGAVILAMLLLTLMTSEGTLRRVVAALPAWSDKRLIVEFFRGVESQISRYIASISAINLMLGVVVGLGLHFVGLPNALLWGVMVALLNFVPYLGAMVGVGVVLLASLVTFDGFVRPAIAASIYVAATTLEGTVITPLILGQRLRLSPGVVFVWILSWLWLWGVPGGLLAMPMLVTLKIAFDHIPGLRMVSALIGR